MKVHKPKYNSLIVAYTCFEKNVIVDGCIAGQEMPVNQIFAVLWDIFQPLLFGLIGAEIDINKIDGKTVGVYFS